MIGKRCERSTSWEFDLSKPYTSGQIDSENEDEVKRTFSLFVVFIFFMFSPGEINDPI